MSAPTMGERPTALVARLAAITTSSEAARKSSGLFVRAACPNSLGRIRRPSTSMPTMTAAPIQMVVISPSSPSLAA